MLRRSLALCAVLALPTALSAQTSPFVDESTARLLSNELSGDLAEALAAGAWYDGEATPEMVEGFFEEQARDGLIAW